MNVTEQLKSIVDGVARSGALTPEAIRQFDELQKRSTELEANLKTRTEEREQARSERDATKTLLRETNEKLAAAIKRAEAAEAKNRQAEDALLCSRYDQAARQEMRSILSDVFRNAEVQRTISNNVSHMVPSSYPGGAPTTQYATDTRTETETRK